MRKIIPQKYRYEISQMTKLATPIIIGQLGVILMGVIDNIMIGRLLDKEALAAASIGNALSYLIGSIAFGGIPVLAPLFAKYKTILSVSLFQKYFWVITYVAIALTLIALLVIYNFQILDQPSSVAPAAKSYFWLIALSNIPMFYFLLGKQVLDSSYKAKVAMYITFIGLLGNTVLNYVFITGAGIITPLGLDGAGLATIFNRVLSLILLLPYLAKYINLMELRFMKPSLEILRGIRFIGYAGIQVFFEIGAFSMAVIMMGWISKTALASHQIAVNVAAVAYMMATGVAYASSIRIGDWLREHHYDLARVAAHVSFVLVSLMMLVTFTVMAVFNTEIVSLYINNKEVIHLAEKLLIIAALFQLSDGVQAVALGNLRGLEDVKIPALLTFIAYWVISLPIGYYLAFVKKLGPQGVWYGLLIGLTIAAFLLVGRFYRQLSKNQSLYFSM